MENYVREDEAIINVINRKKILPTLDYMRSLRSSKAAMSTLNQP